MFLLDTNVVSALRKRRTENTALWVWAEAQTVTAFFVSVVTIFELERGILQLERKDPAQGSVLRAWLDTQIIKGFNGRIIEVDTATAVRCAALHVPDPKSERDALIAATALTRRLQVVTRNTRDFDGTGVSLLNPWAAPPAS
jgi:predicted nucleic acid-binding protein